MMQVRTCSYHGEDGMALLYDSFGVRRLEFVANLWPDMVTFAPRELRQLFGQLVIGPDDEFTSCDLRTDTGARFEGEHWVYDIGTSSILLRCWGYSSPDSLRGTIRRLLRQTRDFFAEKNELAFFVDEIRVYGIVPDEKDRNVGEVVQKRLLKNVLKVDLEGLPGLAGAGLQLVGDAEEFHWHARIEPPHGAYDVLGIGAELMFPPTPDPPSDEDDLDNIDRQVELAHTFITTDVVTFASKLFK
jgi:hypothetical protein